MSERRIRRWAFAAALLALGCGDASAGGPAIAELEVSVEDQGGHTTNAHCAVLPVLLGGRVRAEIDVAGEFSMLLEGTNDFVLLSFEGVRDAAELGLAIDAETLRSTYTERLEVTTTENAEFVVRLASRCAQ